MSRDNTVFVGSKPVMNYVAAIMSSLNSSGEAVVKARGRAISFAVDAVEITRKRFLKDIILDEIEIDTEEVESFDGKMKNVSTIAIVLSRPDY